MVKNASGFGVTGKAIEQNIVELSVWNPRDFTQDNYRTVDDRPYGGGPGMVMKYQPLSLAVQAAKQHHLAERRKVVYLSPQGKPMNQSLFIEASHLTQLILVAGRYEGVDERFVEQDCDEEWSLGDYVISGGELAALVVIDAVTRLIPGVLGDEESFKQDSFMQGLLDCPHFTRYEETQLSSVPNVLLSGNHQEIRKWRLKQSLGRTAQRRPDLLKELHLTAEQEALLEEFMREQLEQG